MASHARPCPSHHPRAHGTVAEMHAMLAVLRLARHATRAPSAARTRHNPPTLTLSTSPVSCVLCTPRATTDTCVRGASLCSPPLCVPRRLLRLRREPWSALLSLKPPASTAVASSLVTEVTLSTSPLLTPASPPPRTLSSGPLPAIYTALTECISPRRRRSLCSFAHHRWCAFDVFSPVFASTP